MHKLSPSFKPKTPLKAGFCIAVDVEIECGELVEVSFLEVIRKGSEEKEVQRLTWWQRKQNCSEGTVTIEQENKWNWSTAERHVEQDADPCLSQFASNAQTHSTATYIDFSIRSELQNKGGY